jgi:hypothetical protein
MIDMPTSTLTATDHIRSAIATLESEVIALTELGIKEGSIVASKTHRGGDQYHWRNGSKRVYVSKKDLAQCQEEIDRGREVAGIQRRIELLKGLV